MLRWIMSRSFTEEGRDLACCANARIWSSFTVKLIPKLCVIVNTCSIIKLTQSSEGSPQLLQVMVVFYSVWSKSSTASHHVFVFQMFSVILQTEHPTLYSVPLSKALNPRLTRQCPELLKSNMNWARDDEELTHRLFYSSVHCFWSITW